MTEQKYRRDLDATIASQLMGFRRATNPKLSGRSHFLSGTIYLVPGDFLTGPSPSWILADEMNDELLVYPDGYNWVPEYSSDLKDSRRVVQALMKKRLDVTIIFDSLRQSVTCHLFSINDQTDFSTVEAATEELAIVLAAREYLEKWDDR